MELTVRTAGEVVAIDSALGWVEELARETLHGAIDVRATSPTMRVEVERTRRSFAGTGWPLLTRGVSQRAGDLLIRDVCTSGFDLLFRSRERVPTFVFRWRPPARTRAAAVFLPSRHHLLVRAALLQYPALWFASRRGVAPLHAPACSLSNGVALLAGPAGVGKTTLIKQALTEGAHANGDNLSAADGRRCWGVVEPQRIEGIGGRQMPHGRGERSLPNRVDVLEPDRVLIIRRGDPSAPRTVVRCAPEVAARALITSTYMAGELRRFWQLSATLALASGIGPAHPPLEEVARQFSTRLECFEVQLPRVERVRLAELNEVAVNYGRLHLNCVEHSVGID